MDIVEFAEGFMNIKLQDWQKRVLQTLDEMGKDAKVRIIMPRHLGREQQVYIYMNAKELITNGQTNDHK